MRGPPILAGFQRGRNGEELRIGDAVLFLTLLSLSVAVVAQVGGGGE